MEQNSIIAVFVRYPFMPIACEGDDDDGTMTTIEMRLKCESRINQAIDSLEKRYGGYIQLWSVL